MKVCCCCARLSQVWWCLIFIVTNFVSVVNVLPVHAVAVVDTNVYLNESSVVLITGAAGFLGSELAMALYHTYQPQKIICVDSVDNGFGVVANATTMSEADLALFEFKRQRIFHLLQQQTQHPHRASEKSSSSTLPSIYFYRVDFRPSIPEYFDTAEVPVLHHIFEEHPEISHVVHFADHVHHAAITKSSPMHMIHRQSTVIPRIRGQEKAGMIESLLEELLLQRDTKQKHIQFVYASSGAVYNHFASNHNNNSPNAPPFSESKPLTTPSTVAGATKLVDELIAKSYFDAYNISSTALRLFHVYGPWGVPGSALFTMAERAVTGQDPILDVNLDDINDYVYIDDAVDATMAAMQFQMPQPKAIAINVGTGKGTSLRTIAKLMSAWADVPTKADEGQQPAVTISYADTQRSSTLLGFTPRVPLEEGIDKLLAWHYDRAYPYGTGSASTTNINEGQHRRQGMVATCNRYDTLCLHGTPVFPCASECSHATTCHRTLYDDVVELTRAMTTSCPTVLYTVDLNETLTHLPSTRVRVSTQSIAYIEPTGNAIHCNIAFVSDSSPLYDSLSREEAINSRRRSLAASTDGVIKHGFWSLVPVAVTKYSREKLPLLALLPKISPGKFFADTVEKAIYCDPDVIVDNIPQLIKESNMQPKHPTVQGATVMLIGRKPVDIAAQQRPLQATTIPAPWRQVIQEDAYRMIRMAVIDEMVGDGFVQKLDSGLVVHTLRRMNGDDDDGRMFRCDVFGEIIQWQVSSDFAAYEFILGLHDMWSRVMVKQSGIEAWWIGEDVTSVSKSTHVTNRRLMQERHIVDHPKEDNEQDNENGSGDGDDTKGDDDLANRQKSDKENKQEEDEDDEGDADDAEDAELTNVRIHNEFGAIDPADSNRARHNMDIAGGGEHKQQQERFGERPKDEELDDDNFVVDDDDGAERHNPLRRKNSGAKDNERGDGAEAGDDAPHGYYRTIDRDPSSYDVWMGVLSSTNVRYFCRIVSMDAVGVYRIKEDLDEVVLSAM